ncbi:hypothetical protein BFJ65_g10790 [Fusarium oxysporum f. sp. cepae]|uniref:Uncharacterized protein n=1 Tax=Fusarium oxysporum f. sp. cepae TaxID=396571 RepID=A0A3L6NAH4_FUSOX|nr:hypothetical protein BFJ65_g10790 [Fusarium oxysporum f. sp. cepae]
MCSYARQTTAARILAVAGEQLRDAGGSQPESVQKNLNQWLEETKSQ